LLPNTVGEFVDGHRIDYDALGRHCHGRFSANNPLGRSSVIRVQCALFIVSHLSITLGKDLLGRIAGEPTVVMLVVVSGEVLFAPRACVGEVVEDLGIVRLIFLGLELGLRKLAMLL
jgi:hypothetical protein